MRTGRPPKSDADKKRRGTLDPRFTEQARAARSEDKIVSLFGGEPVSVIPDPPPGLDATAAAEFQEWCQRLLDLGKLSKVWIMKVELMALARHANLRRLADGKLPRSQDIITVKAILSDLGSFNIDKPTAIGSEQTAKFAYAGFANRKRPA